MCYDYKRKPQLDCRESFCGRQVAECCIETKTSVAKDIGEEDGRRWEITRRRWTRFGAAMPYPDFVIIGFSGFPPAMIANLKMYSRQRLAFVELACAVSRKRALSWADLRFLWTLPFYPVLAFSHCYFSTSLPSRGLSAHMPLLSDHPNLANLNPIQTAPSFPGRWTIQSPFIHLFVARSLFAAFSRCSHISISPHASGSWNGNLHEHHVSTPLNKPLSPRASLLSQDTACHPRRHGLDSQQGSSRNFSRGNCAGRCRWQVGFLEDLPLPPPLHSDATPFSPHFTLIGSQGLGYDDEPQIESSRDAVAAEERKGANGSIERQ
ncbi:hypothetical protein PR048_022071 [Dryococelus australis]|uniref:Uncharacterized protein n=1 Tax=Dryococelus australis TaxID=614101 RepID=A0ABQ9H025_9NEOP|nr:hypothetical protein PR048_022071 [Dryococelus australis]